jgi:LCP family protein required for cell wall assembly
MPGGPASYPQGFNSFNQANPGSAFAPPGMGAMVARPVPGTFNPNRPMGPGSFGDGPVGPGGRRTDGPIPPGKGPHGKKKRRVPVWARVLIGFLTVVLVLCGGGLAYYQFYFSGSVSHIVGQTVQRAKGEEDPNANLTGGILSGPRVNILLLGSDTDQKFQGTYLAQTDIVVTIDPASHTVGMLSIPRDFYIPVPGYGLHKLDEAYSLGGIDLSRRTIQQDFGIPINYYAWVGLDGFIKVINEVNGVDVDVLHPIVDDNYPDDTGANANDPYALKRLDLSPGPQHLDGATALEYVRSRHADLVGDFGRSARQQQVLSALKNKLANPDIFNHLSAIANDLQGSLKTDMQLSDILKLMNFARSLDVNKINKLILGPPYSHSGTSPSGASAVFPNCAQIIPAISQMLQLGNNAVCNIQGDSGGPTHLPVAYTAGHTSPQAVSSSNTTGLSDMASGGPSDLSGMQSLLDLMLMGVFESPNVF